MAVEMRGQVREQIDDRVSWVRAFSTRRAGDPVERVRTRGQLLGCPADDPWPTGFASGAVTAGDFVDDAAYGKLAVLREGAAETASVQLADMLSEGEIAACSNATAAAVAWHAVTTGSLPVSLSLALPGARVSLSAEVRERGRSSSVRQAWHGVHVELTEDTEVDGRRVAVCTGSLNNYLVVRTRPGEATSQFTLIDALTLWQHFGMHDEPLLSRMAVTDGDARDPAMQFFTCGTRAHPSAAPTGLAVVEFAARTLDWLHPMPTTVRTRGGRVEVPRVHLSGDGSADVEFPEVFATIGEPIGAPTRAA